MGTFLKNRTLLILMGATALALGCGRAAGPQVEKKDAALPLPEKTVAVRLSHAFGPAGKNGLPLAAISLGEPRPIDSKDPVPEIPEEPEPQVWSLPQPLEEGLKNLVKALQDRQYRDGVRLVLQIEVDQKTARADEVAQVVAACKAAGFEKMSFIAPWFDLLVEDVPEMKFENPPTEKVEVPQFDPSAPIGIADPKDPNPNVEPFSVPGLSGGYGQGGFSGRSGSTRERIPFPGNSAAEAAVSKSLDWLALQQQSDGSWLLSRDAAQAEPLRATSLSLLAFLGAGRTHRKSANHKHAIHVDQGLKWLLKNQDKTTGAIAGPLQDQALAVLTLCEAYGLSSDPALRRPAEAALRHLLKGQQEDGGWGESSSPAGDVGAFPWIVMALRSAQMVGLHVPSPALDKARRRLDKLQAANTDSGNPEKKTNPTLAAAYQTSWRHLHPGKKLPAAFDQGLKNSLVPGQGGFTLGYFVVQNLHFEGGEENLSLARKWRDHLVATQVKDKGPNLGSWEAVQDSSAPQDRMVATTLAILQLETYYRHLTIWNRSRE